MKEKRYKTSVGGQALIEGVMMRGPKSYAVAVRCPDGHIDVVTTPLKPERPIAKIPFVRGIFNFGSTLITGYGCLMRAAELSMSEEEQAVQTASKFEAWVDAKLGEKGTNFLMSIAALLGGGLAIVLFMILPTFFAGTAARFLPIDGYKTLLEGVLKIIIFILYLALVSRMKDIKRMFAYHGAEHKTIACYEAGESLTPENARKFTRFHPRCGTSFLFIVIVVSIALFSFLPWTGTGMRVVYKLLALPLVVGISYEIIKFAGRHDNFFTRILSAPGLWLQRLTTNEPDDSMLEVAIAAMIPVLPEVPNEAKW